MRMHLYYGVKVQKMASDSISDERNRAIISSKMGGIRRVYQL